MPVSAPFLSESGTQQIGIDICICSYRRPEIVDTLAAIAKQQGMDSVRLRIVVADNSADLCMRPIVLEAAKILRLDLQYVPAPANNISIARNACLDAAQGHWIAFLDDDEIPTTRWLSELYSEAIKKEWDAVLGPVDAIYPPSMPAWLQQGQFHSTRPVWIRGRINTGYTGNVLLRRAFVETHGLRFLPELGRSGGEDADFFYRFTDLGGRIGYAGQAVVCEPVPKERTTVRWLLRRNFRAGQTHGFRLLQSNRRVQHTMLASGKAALFGSAALLTAANTTRRNKFLVRSALQCGVVARLLGVGEIQMY